MTARIFGIDGIFAATDRMSSVLSKVRKGDTLHLTETADGGYRLTPYNPELARQMALAEEIMHNDREVLRALAK